MKPLPNSRWVVQSALALLVVASVVGCGKKLQHLFIANQLPQVRITSAPIDTTQRCDPDPVRSCYVLTLNWVGTDPDGSVDHYLYAKDPPSRAGEDTTWLVTADNELRLEFSSTREIAAPSTQSRRFDKDSHVFVIKAVDNRGDAGPYVARAFYSFTEAPTVQIEDPRPDASVPIVPPSVHIRWSGKDADGVFHNKPVQYKFLLLSSSSLIPVDAATSNPDTLRQYYAPLGYATWDSIGGDTTEVQLTNLTPEQTYMFVVVAVDEAGAFSPLFNLGTNMFRFKIGFAGAQGPHITFFNEFFNYSYTFGSYCPCAESEVFLELPARQTITMNWSAEQSTGTSVRSYRWALDIADVADDTPRSDEELDTAHWSAASINVTSAQLGPFLGNETHRLYVECEDNVGLKSLGIVRFNSVLATFENPLLIVDDTRLVVDQNNPATPGCVRTPLNTTTWPTAAELDTFLYAIGGVPWRCYVPAVNSPPGIFHGYPFDTIGTRIGRNDVTVRLGVLGHYRHLIWITDQDGAVLNGAGSSATGPITSLRYMNSTGRVNTLGAYVKQNGQVWALGGGVAFASNINYNDRNNDTQALGAVFRTSGLRRELAVGRFMFDLPHWQTGFAVKKDQFTIKKYLGRYRSRPDPDPNHWSNVASLLPDTYERKDVQPRDPLPPYRQASNFYTDILPIEFLLDENFIIEDLDPNPEIDNEQSTLDTMYYATGGGLPGSRDVAFCTVMTYYHGPAIPQGILFSGFNIWGYRRAHCQALVDFVLQQMWQMTRSASPSAVRSGPVIEAAAAPAARPAGTPPVWKPAPTLRKGWTHSGSPSTGRSRQ